jgi:hypothetical protein
VVALFKLGRLQAALHRALGWCAFSRYWGATELVEGNFLGVGLGWVGVLGWGVGWLGVEWRDLLPFPLHLL